MTDHVEIFPLGEPTAPARLLGHSRARVSHRLRIDRLTRRFVTLGGLAIIMAILAIFFVIAAEVYPLLKPPTATPLGTISTQVESTPLTVGVEEYREVAFLVTASGVHFFAVQDGRPLAAPTLPGLDGAQVVGTSSTGGGRFALGLSDGRILPIEVQFIVSYPEGERQITPQLVVGDALVADAGGHTIEHIAYSVTPTGPIAAAALGPSDLVLLAIRERRALIGPSAKEELRRTMALPIAGEISALALDDRGEDLFVGTSSGQVMRVNLRHPSEPMVADTVAATSRRGVGVTVLGFLIGDRTLIVGDAVGGVSSWQLLRHDDGEPRLTKIYDFAAHRGPVIGFSKSHRNKGFMTSDENGVVHLHYGTTGKTLLTVNIAGNGMRGVAYAPKTDGLLAVDSTGQVSHWMIENPHPEITLKSLFGKVWYEGYTAPEYVWQSTGGTDDFEAKFSLTPLIYGTLKGTFYALLFAVPLALMGAMYASQFMHPALKAIVKPVVEIMAALPSVVLGFIAGLWLAPIVEDVVPGIFLMPIMVPAVIILTLVGWRCLPTTFRHWLRPGGEVFLLIPVTLIGGWLAIQLGGLVEAWMLGNDYRSWLLHTLGLTYDQRNSLVVGFAMGFAVIPIIFTIADDSLTNVPQHLTAGSLALGATRWQTAVRIVLPTASPGIFSAIMIGFGRAVGETMIVLMATGNTPVMDWSIFNGFRALSANIAVELPEAPEGGTLFRVLFLAALLLFGMTFVVNTAAELVRLRLRKRYRLL
jgi:phosphate transport system permease protein